MDKQNDEVGIDLLELLNYLKKRIWIILAVVVVCAGLSFFVTKFLMTPEYTASTRMYVLNRSSETTVVYSDFQTSTQLLKDYEVLITGQNVTELVISQLGLSMGNGELANMIKVSTPSDTRVLQISVTDTDPQRAADIANTVREVAADQIQDIMDVDAVKDVYAASVPTAPSGPNVMQNTAMAGIIGLVAVLGILIAIFLLDDTISTEDDVEYYLGMSVLGVIPVSDDMEAMISNGSAKKKKRGFARGTDKK